MVIEISFNTEGCSGLYKCATERKRDGYGNCQTFGLIERRPPFQRKRGGWWGVGMITMRSMNMSMRVGIWGR